jgi:DNA polymerase-3 subunit gamma/tau
MAADVRAMLGTLDHGQVFDVLHALIEGDAKALLEAVRHLAEQGPDWNGVLSEILNVLHRVAIAQALPEGVDNGHGDRDRVLALAQALPAEDVQFYYQMGLIGRRDLPLAPDPRGGRNGVAANAGLPARRHRGCPEATAKASGDQPGHS